MSLKAYEAYRFPRNKLDEFLPLFDETCAKAVSKDILAIGHLNPKGLKKTRRSLFGLKRNVNKEFSDQDIGIIWVLAQWMLASKRPEHDPLNFDCACNLWMKGKWCYMMPYTSRMVKFDKGMPDWIKFYGYWDNTDAEEGVSPREWKRRGVIWNEITDNWDKNRLTHITFEMKMPHLVGLLTLLKAMNQDKDWVSRIYSSASLLYWKEERREKDLA